MNLSAHTEHIGDGAFVVSLAGEADLYTASVLKEELLRAIARDGKTIVLDLREVTFLDSTALGVLVQAQRRLRPSGGQVAIVCTDAYLRRTFALTALDRLFAIYGSRAEAVQELALNGSAAGPVRARR